MDGFGVVFFFSVVATLFAIVVFIRVRSADVPPVTEPLRAGIASLVRSVFELDPKVMEVGSVVVLLPTLDESNPELVAFERFGPRVAGDDFFERETGWSVICPLTH